MKQSINSDERQEAIESALENLDKYVSIQGRLKFEGFIYITRVEVVVHKWFYPEAGDSSDDLSIWWNKQFPFTVDNLLFRSEMYVQFLRFTLYGYTLEETRTLIGL